MPVVLNVEKIGKAIVWYYTKQIMNVFIRAIVRIMNIHYLYIILQGV